MPLYLKLSKITIRDFLKFCILSVPRDENFTYSIVRLGNKHKRQKMIKIAKIFVQLWDIKILIPYQNSLASSNPNRTDQYNTLSPGKNRLFSSIQYFRTYSMLNTTFLWFFWVDGFFLFLAYSQPILNHKLFLIVEFRDQNVKTLCNENLTEFSANILQLLSVRFLQNI